jgi:glycyl-tRNA synthetase
MENTPVSLEKIVSLCKRRGFIFPGSEIYGGLAGAFDYGPHGLALKKNIEQLWWSRFVSLRDDMYGVDAAILMNKKVWEASGHVGGFNDPLVEDTKTKKRYRADHLLEDAGIDPKGMTIAQMDAAMREKELLSPDGNPLGEVRQFNMMLKTYLGATEDESSVTYLRPETAGGMFVNFKNILDAFHPKLPFGMAQIGKAFRNEIAPREFLFRVRELEQMEIEYFVHPDEWRAAFDALQEEQVMFLVDDLGLTKSRIHQIEIPAEDRAHYSKHSVDTEFDFPMGQKELLGLAYRTDFDLTAHTQGSGEALAYFDEETKERITPHCVEPTFGLGRLVLAVLADAYTEDELGGEVRTYLKLSPKVAPIKAMVSPLLKNKAELVEKAKEIRKELQKIHPAIAWDDNGNIGKRYRRQDEIGTPFCITIDFDTLGETPELEGTVTIRHRDTGEQERMTIAEVGERIRSAIA